MVFFFFFFFFCDLMVDLAVVVWIRRLAVLCGLWVEVLGRLGWGFRLVVGWVWSLIDWLGWGFRPFSIIMIFFKFVGGFWRWWLLWVCGVGGYGSVSAWLWVYGVGGCGFVPVVAMGFVVDMSLVMGLCRWWYHWYGCYSGMGLCWWWYGYGSGCCWWPQPTGCVLLWIEELIYYFNML